MERSVRLRDKPPARRRKTLTMTMATGEVRLSPDVWSLATSARLISAALALTMLLAGLGMATNDAFYILNPTVVGNDRLPAADVVTASGIQNLHVAWFDPELARQSLLKNLPELVSAEVRCGLPSNCSIRVVERQPAFEWQQGQARTWVDANGRAFPARGDTPDIPRVEALPGTAPLLPGQQADQDLAAAMAGLAQALPEVKSYRYSSGRGIEFADPSGHWPVYLGVGQGMADRVGMWRTLSASLASRNIRPKFVDVHLSSAPYYAK